VRKDLSVAATPPAGSSPSIGPKSTEAAFGKNPTYHAGKVYSIHAEMTARIHAEMTARAVHAATGTPAAVTIMARHSDPLRTPALVHIGVHGDADHTAAADVARTTLATTDHLALALDGHLIPR
jgi:S-adenosylmethionine synthetase